jgi:hypothetical protein
VASAGRLLRTTTMKNFWIVLAVAAPLSTLGACQLATNVALKRSDSLWAEQNACLKANIAQFDSRASDAEQVGRQVAMSCSAQTEKLVRYVLPTANRRDYEAFEVDATQRSLAYVLASRGAPTG